MLPLPILLLPSSASEKRYYSSSASRREAVPDDVRRFLQSPDEADDLTFQTFEQLLSERGAR